MPDSRFAKWFPSLSKYLVMSDCAVGGYVVYGTPVDGAELTVEGMAGYTGKCYHDGQLVKQGKTSEVLGNPVNSMQWLVGKLASQGKSFKRGMHASVGTVFVRRCSRRASGSSSTTAPSAPWSSRSSK